MTAYGRTLHHNRWPHIFVSNLILCSSRVCWISTVAFTFVGNLSVGLWFHILDSWLSMTRRNKRHTEAEGASILTSSGALLTNYSRNMLAGCASCSNALVSTCRPFHWNTVRQYFTLTVLVLLAVCFDLVRGGSLQEVEEPPVRYPGKLY